MSLQFVFFHMYTVYGDTYLKQEVKLQFILFEG